MPPPLKTYRRKKVLPISHSETRMNALFTKNLYARKETMVTTNVPKKSLQINKLPIIDANHELLNDSNTILHVKGADDTFEKLKNNLPPRVLRSSSNKQNSAIPFTSGIDHTEDSVSNGEFTKSFTTDSNQPNGLTAQKNELENTPAKHYNLKRSVSTESFLSYSHMFENYDTSLQGSAKRKQTTERNRELNLTPDSNIDISIDAEKKSYMNPGKVVISSTPLPKNRNLKKLEVLSPICVPDSANNSLLQESIQQIYNWSYQAPEATAYNQISQRKTRNSQSCQLSCNQRKAGLKRSSSFSSFVTMKFASNQYPKRSKLELAIVVSKIPDEELLKTLKEQYERYKDMHLSSTSTEEYSILKETEVNDNIIISSDDEGHNIELESKECLQINKDNVTTRKKFCVTNNDFEKFFVSNNSMSNSYEHNSNVNKRRRLPRKAKHDLISYNINMLQTNRNIINSNSCSDRENSNDKTIDCFTSSDKQLIKDYNHTEEEIDQNLFLPNSGNSILNEDKCRFVNKRRRLPRKTNPNLAELNCTESNKLSINNDGRECHNEDVLIKNVQPSSSSERDLQLNTETNDAKNVLCMPIIESVRSLHDDSIHEEIETDNIDVIRSLHDDSIHEEIETDNFDVISLNSSDSDVQDLVVVEKTSCCRMPLRATFEVPILLEPSKLWRRSLAKFKRESIMQNTLNGQICFCATCTQTNLNKTNSARKSTYVLSREEVRKPSQTCQIQNDHSYSKTVKKRTPHPIHVDLQLTRRVYEIAPLPFRGFPIEETSLEELKFEECNDFNYRYKRKGSIRKPRDSGYEPHRLRETVQLEKLIEDISLNVSQLNVSSANNCAKNIVLQRCGQVAPLNFSKCYPPSLLRNCHKIGEGVYGEVFLYRNPKGGATVMKVIPIEGEMLVNGEKQKQFEEIISEIIIASELSNLRVNPINLTSAFNEVQRIKCVKGKYPKALIDLWEMYDESKGSENDNPEIFNKDQLYIVLELAYAGSDMESFVFTNFCEVYHCFIQVAMSLAVAEEELQFEHRDLHWGNVLMTKTSKNENCSFKLGGTLITVPTQGVLATIIDFTLSRITYDNICMYNDLSQDPDLFNAEGDYQFEIYRQMQKNNGNNWEKFSPYSNVLWLHYLLVKMTTSVNFVRKGIAARDKVFLNNLVEWENGLLNYKSAKQFVLEAVTPKLNERNIV